MLELDAQYQAEKEAKRKAEEEEEERDLAELETYIRKKRLASEKDVEVQAEEDDGWSRHESGEDDEWAGLGSVEKGEDELEGDEEEENDDSDKESKDEDRAESEYDVNEAGEDNEGTEVDYATCKLPATY
ncbi:hypothetical protein BG006_001979 [Podila minutissima]|uniref:Uncharacterized protein n=1 Tax=Podila minutissima TaxID=64525 RepID=A0A9P5SC88_9FUNG|nr:hypothetical protein BG006_001979 [Podila minutissima]